MTDSSNRTLSRASARAAVALLFISIVAVPTVNAQAKPHRSLLLEISDVDRDELRKGLFAFDDYGGAIISSLPGRISVMATEAERAVLLERGYNVTTIAQDSSELALRKRSLYGESLELSSIYYTYEQILAVGDSLIDAHPDLIRRQQIGVTTQENSRYLRVSNCLQRSIRTRPARHPV